jgi:hypothetical protein
VIGWAALLIYILTMLPGFLCGYFGSLDHHRQCLDSYIAPESPFVFATEHNARLRVRCLWVRRSFSSRVFGRSREGRGADARNKDPYQREGPIVSVIPGQVLLCSSLKIVKMGGQHMHPSLFRSQVLGVCTASLPLSAPVGLGSAEPHFYGTPAATAQGHTGTQATSWESYQR